MADTDSLGFCLLGLTQTEYESRKACQSREASSAAKWRNAEALRWAYSPAEALPPKALKALAREGIPAALRPRLWFQYSGGLARQQLHGADYYEHLLHHPVLDRTSPPLEVDARYADVWRTLHPGHLLLTRAASVGAAQRLVGAYMAHSAHSALLVTDTELRHLGCLAAFLLAVQGPAAEARAFFTLLALVEDRLPQSCVLQGEDSGVVEQRVLQALLARRSPSLARSCVALGLSVPDVTAAWFPCAFAATLPAETTARVWDALLVEGPKVLFRIGLALFKMNEASLKSQGMMASRQLRWRIARTYDADQLMKVAFKGISSLSGSVIAKVRLEQVAAWLPEPRGPVGSCPSAGVTSRLAVLHASCERLVQGTSMSLSTRSGSSGSLTPRSQ